LCREVSIVLVCRKNQQALTNRGNFIEEREP
jgi:hypothetical protein